MGWFNNKIFKNHQNSFHLFFDFKPGGRLIEKESAIACVLNGKGWIHGMNSLEVAFHIPEQFIPEFLIVKTELY